MVEILQGFRGLKDTKSWGTSQYITPGSYLLRLKEFRQHESTDPLKKNTTFFFAICDVMLVTYNHNQDPKFTAGSEISWSVNMSQPSGPNDLVNFFEVVFKPEGLTKKDFDDDFLVKVFTNGMGAYGREFVAEAYNKPTKAGTPFTHVAWSLYEEPVAAPDAPAPSEAPAA